MFPSMRTKRRRVAAGVPKILAELKNDKLHAVLIHSENLETVTDTCKPLSLHVITTFNKDVSVNSSDNLNVVEYEDCSEWRCRPIGDSDSEEDDNASSENIQEQLASWARSDNISQASLTRLLCILKPSIPDLPRDARSLLSTPRNILVKSVAGGEYYYFGIRFWLEKLLGVGDHNMLLTETLHLHINIDGIPLFKCSSVSLWPILGIFKELKLDRPLPIAIFLWQIYANHS